jgi:hypothetical protein
VAPNAPRVEIIHIPQDKIGEVIGPRGKIIKELVEQTGAQIDVDEEAGRGVVRIYATSAEMARAARDRINAIANPTLPEAGERYQATVVKTVDFGAFVSLTPGVDGLLHISRDNGATWQNITPKGLPDWMRWSIIEASPHDPGTAWVAGNRYQMDDFTPYLYRTTDYGATWTKITTGITADHFTRAIREDLHRPGMVYAATERGVWVSYNKGDSWTSLQRNLPPVPVHDMMLRDDDLAIATHGRAFWVMENLTPLRWAPEQTANAPMLYKPVPVYRLPVTAPPQDHQEFGAWCCSLGNAPPCRPFLARPSVAYHMTGI